MFYKAGHLVALTGAISFPVIAQISPSQVDSTIHGILQAENLTDRGVWIALLVVVISLCAMFLRNAAKEVERVRTASDARDKQFQEKLDKFIEVQKDSIKVIERNTVLFESVKEAIQDFESSRRLMRMKAKGLEHNE